jgi:hypothetical protein
MELARPSWMPPRRTCCARQGYFDVLAAQDS